VDDDIPRNQQAENAWSCSEFLHVRSFSVGPLDGSIIKLGETADRYIVASQASGYVELKRPDSS
jgi:hypothetical protein